MKFTILMIGLLAVYPLAAEEPDEPAWLGVWLSEAVDGGIEIVALVPGGPAQRAGLLRGDILLEADGESLRREDAVGRLLMGRRPGEALELIVLRDGESLSARVELGRRPPRVAAAPRVPDPPQARLDAYAAFGRARAAVEAPFGVQAVVVTPALLTHFGAPDTPDASGVLVTRVEPGRLAERAGLRVGDLLLSIDGVEITDPARLREALSAWDRVEPLEARIVREGKAQLLRVPAQPREQSSAENEWAEAIRKAQREQRERERVLLERRLRLEIERLERRIEELRRNVERIREQQGD